MTFPLESEVSQPPRPGPAFLMGSQSKQGARGRGKLRGLASPRHLIAPSFHSSWEGGVLMPEIPPWGERDRNTKGLRVVDPMLVTCRCC